MLCLCLCLAPPRPCDPLLPKHVTSLLPSASATALPRRRRSSASINHQVGELGHTVLASLQSNPNSNPKLQIQRNREEGEESQISGSDVLWALQKASARKKKRKNSKQEYRRELSSVNSSTEESAVDYSNVPPLCINANWDAKLDELEKRLRELSDTI